MYQTLRLILRLSRPQIQRFCHLQWSERSSYDDLDRRREILRLRLRMAVCGLLILILSTHVLHAQEFMEMKSAFRYYQQGRAYAEQNDIERAKHVWASAPRLTMRVRLPLRKSRLSRLNQLL